MNKTIGIILNNPSANLGQLTEHRNPITLPFYARYRLVDFTLSNMVNTGLKKIGIIASDKYRSLLDHIGTGQEWGLSRKSQSLSILQGANRLTRSMNVNINMMDFSKNRNVFKRSYAEDILIASPNNVYHMNYAEAINYHKEQHNDITFISVPVSDNINNHANDVFIGCNDEMEVSNIEFGKQKSCNYKYVGMLIISQKTMLDFIEYSEVTGEIDLLEILKDHLNVLNVGNVVFEDYLRCIHSVKDYYETSMELLDLHTCRALFKTDGKFYTKEKDNHPTRYMESGDVKSSCIASGGEIAGTVYKSVLFRKVTIEEGASITNSVIMEGCEIGKNAVLDYVIADRNAIIHDNMKLVGTKEKPIILSKEMEI